MMVSVVQAEGAGDAEGAEGGELGLVVGRAVADGEGAAAAD
jgi:hypothetical protein